MSLDVHVIIGLHATFSTFAVLLSWSTASFEEQDSTIAGCLALGLPSLRARKAGALGHQKLSGRRALRVMTPSTKGLGGPT